MFKVKGTVVSMRGDPERFPCHCCLEIGDEIYFDGGSFTGRLCPDLWPKVAEKAAALYAAGPRYIEPINYYAFNYACISQSDPGKKVFDGYGFKNVFEGYDLPKYHNAHLIGGTGRDGRFAWPPPEKRKNRPVTVMCPDIRTAVVVKLEAVDVTGGGFALPYYRRQMVILDRVNKKPGIAIVDIINEFSKEEIEDYYPPLSQIQIDMLVEELACVGHMELKDGKAFVTPKGASKAEDFKKTLSPEERKALKI